MPEHTKARGMAWVLVVFSLVVTLSMGWHLQIKVGTIDDGVRVKRFVRVHLPGTIPSMYLAEDTLVTFTVYDRYGLRILSRGAACGPPARSAYEPTNAPPVL